ncbi:potassium-transporting ATPase subunit KdpB [Phragmitibacter flavus]|uniref:Potassium-transporting ATPase ATP-binding subunit n=1 Tax=Phragmitibacter flavus TaxID=2576071 RepID=A0A5R8KD64_9BACT|nr:potassium-transporting ATPase subunit KdpB [Phragmitibacter flavus]TLD70246.1 potassium-transporting ATPase subunit KdpB [Phragmitibacter flavus]
MSTSLFDWQIARPAIPAAFKKLHPRLMIQNPVMALTLLGAITTTFSIFTTTPDARGFTLQLSLWLWFTVLFANFAEAIAEGRGKAQADTLRKARKDTTARRLKSNGSEETIPAQSLQKGDTVICETGDLIPADGEVIEGIASVDEAAITGESAPVIRESGGDRSAVTGGTRVISDRILIRITSEKGNTFIDRMISMVEGAQRQKTPNEIALTILLTALTLIFLGVVVTLHPFARYAGLTLSLPVLTALLVCLIPTTIGALLSAIGISGIDRLIRRNVIATSGRAVEAAGDIDVLLLDKTGTITIGNRMASDFRPAPGITEAQLADAAQLASLADETPEGRSIVILAKEKFNLRARDLTTDNNNTQATFIPFTAQTRMSGVDIDQRRIRKGAADSIRQYIQQLGGSYPSEVTQLVETASRAGRTPLVVAEGNQVLGVVELKDVVKGGIKQRFAQLRQMGIRTVMITGDNPMTAAAIAAEAGVDDFMAQATPEDKLNRIRHEQAQGRLVAMTGDGTNDAPALAQADVGVAMNTGTQAAREAGNMVDLDSNPTKLIEIVEIGKQLLMTRGALTTFSISNDVAKYFAIIPAMLMATFPAIAPLNIMRLASPESAILSAIIFNALIIIALIPLALRGVPYRAVGATAALQRNLLIYGLGGLILPFIGIKAIDLIITTLHLV